MSQLKNTAIENLTPEQLALLSEKLNKLSGIKKKKEQIEKRKNIDESPMSSAQKRLWFLHQLDPQSSNYNIFSALCLKGEFHLYALEYSLNQIIKRHEVLRSVYSTKGNEPLQIILPSLEIKLVLTDISELDETAKQKRLQEILQAEANKPFNLSEGPLLRSEIIRLNENEHILMLNMHHIIADGWSFNILISEIAALYRSNIFNTKASLEELKIQYSDFAQWQNERLEDKAFDTQLSFWKEKLGNMPNTLELPFYKKSASLRSNLGERKIFFISQKMRNHIERIAKGESATLFMALLSVFQIMLYKLSRQDDFGIGIPIANRNRPEIEKLIGFFVNTLVIRVKDIENLTFRELLGKLRDYMTEAFDNQDIPFDKVVEALMPKREINTTPLFQVMFDMQSSYTQSLKFPALETDIVDFNTQNSKFDLLLMIEDTSDRLKCTFEYNTDLFKESSITQMTSHFQNLIKQVVQSPEKRISEIEILSNEEYETITSIWNFGEVRPSYEMTFPELFEIQAATTPLLPAVMTTGQGSLTYDELNKRANKLAHYLIKKGASAEKFVAVCMNRSQEMLIAIVGILKTGAAYVPIDPAYPKERIKVILKEIPEALIVSDEELLKKGPLESFLPDIEKVILYEKDKGLINCEEDSDPKVKVLSQNKAYMIFTSGSTGVPKGVVIEHHSLMNLFYTLKEKIYSSYGKKLKVSLNAPIFFDASLQQIVSLLDGHCIYIIPQEIRANGNELLDFVISRKIDLLDCVPSQLKILLESGMLNNERFKPLACLPGGEAISKDVWDKLTSQQDIDFYNMYGPTECTVDSIVSYINQYPGTPNIGRPVFNTSVYILDRFLRPVPMGVKGEIYIGGAALGRGYHAHPEMTAERYIPDPFGSSGGRLYKTGDLGRFLDGGIIEYCGRADFQVKVRGFRIELTEIENVLRKHPSVKEVLVDTFESGLGNKSLVAYLVPVDGTDRKVISILKDFMRSQLPEYMVPSVFHFMEKFPLTSNGKIDRRKLPKISEILPEVSNSESLSEIQSDTEKKLADIWKDVLKLERLGLDDNFFELGGDSIMSIQVIAKSNQAGIKITPKQMFMYPTIRGLALASEINAVKADQSLLSGPVTLSPIQRWFFEKQFTDENLWNQSNLFKLKERLDPVKLKEALSEIIRHHDMLRAFYRKDSNEIKQIIRKDIPEDVFYYIKADHSFDNYDELLNQIDKIQSSFNIGESSLIKMAYIETFDEKSSYLFISVHHLVIDGVSWRILLDDLWNVYGQTSQNKKVTLALKTTSYKEWVEKLNDYANSEKVGAMLNYWKDNLPSDFRKLPLDYDKRAENLEESSDVIMTSLSKEDTDSLQHKIQNTQIGLFSINELLIAALYKTITQWTNSSSLYIDLENHGRDTQFSDQIDISRTIGWFTSIYPLYIKAESVDGNISEVGNIISMIKEKINGIPEKGISYSLLKYLNKNNTLSENIRRYPTPEMSYNYLGQFNQEISQSGYEILSSAVKKERAIKNKRLYILDFSASIIDQRLNVYWTYSKNLHSKKTISDLADLYMSNLQAILKYILSSNINEILSSNKNDFGLDEKQIENLLDELDEG